MPNTHAAFALANHAETQQVQIASRFNGPPKSGNGGWTAGLFGKHLGTEIEVTLKRPIPVDESLDVVLEDAGGATLLHGSTEIASARRAELDIDIPDSVGFALAAEARAKFTGYKVHPFPNCFVCGTGRCCGEGMCLFTGPTEKGIVASSWIPSAELSGADGEAPAELICAALDCPGAWALIDRYGIEGPFVLGRITYRLQKPIYAGEKYVVMGWARGREGRKSFCGTGVYDANGELCAAASATWIQLT